MYMYMYVSTYVHMYMHVLIRAMYMYCIVLRFTCYLLCMLYRVSFMGWRGMPPAIPWSLFPIPCHPLNCWEKLDTHPLNCWSHHPLFLKPKFYHPLSQCLNETLLVLKLSTSFLFQTATMRFTAFLISHILFCKLNNI